MLLYINCAAVGDDSYLLYYDCMQTNAAWIREFAISPSRNPTYTAKVISGKGSVATRTSELAEGSGYPLNSHLLLLLIISQGLTFSFFLLFLKGTLCAWINGWGNHLVSPWHPQMPRDPVFNNSSLNILLQGDSPPTYPTAAEHLDGS